jgi:hypothetical protein
MRRIAVALLMCAGLQARAADDFEVDRLEQQVLELERRVDTLSRELASLQQRVGAQASRVTQPMAEASPSAAVAAESPKWFDIASWNRLRVGMGELEVIAALGPPTTVRGSPVAEAATLLYALELGPGAFLSGSVRLEKRVVVEINLPILR